MHAPHNRTCDKSCPVPSGICCAGFVTQAFQACVMHQPVGKTGFDRSPLSSHLIDHWACPASCMVRGLQVPWGSTCTEGPGGGGQGDWSQRGLHGAQVRCGPGARTTKGEEEIASAGPHMYGTEEDRSKHPILRSATEACGTGRACAIAVGPHARPVAALGPSASYPKRSPTIPTVLHHFVSQSHPVARRWRSTLTSSTLSCWRSFLEWARACCCATCRWCLRARGPPGPPPRTRPRWCTRQRWAWSFQGGLLWED